KSDGTAVGHFEQLVDSFAIRKLPGHEESFGQPARSQADAAERFTRLVAASRLLLWQSGDPIWSEGRRILLGVMTASMYDMRLLDVLDAAVATGETGTDRVEVFNWQSITSEAEQDRYVPGVGFVFHTPVIGMWEHGRLTATSSGPEARDALLSHYGLLEQ